jgi:hypothetical protein
MEVSSRLPRNGILQRTFAECRVFVPEAAKSVKQIKPAGSVALVLWPQRENGSVCHPVFFDIPFNWLDCPCTLTFIHASRSDPGQSFALPESERIGIEAYG